MAMKARLAIIGAGTAGLTALKEARRHTDDVVLINDGPYGTTCARVGCMPSKALLAAAHAFQYREFLHEAGVRGTASLTADIPAVLSRVRRLRDRFVRGPTELARSLGERSISGRPRFLDANTVAVDDVRIEAEATVIATGTRPIVPAPWRALGRRLLTSDSVFEQDNLGRHVAVIGLGGIGCELGQALGQLGLTVHGFTRDSVVAGVSDPAVNEKFIESLRRSMTVTTNADVALEPTGKSRVRVRANGEITEVDWVLAAVGRTPNLEGLGLEDLGSAVDAGGLPAVDPMSLRIGDLPIYVAGDVNGIRPLMHEAADEGRIAAYHALHPRAECLARRTGLAIAFTEPNVARVGTGFDELQGDTFVVGDADFSSQPRALMMGRNEGCLRVYASIPEGRLLGAEMCVPEGEHLAHLLAWALQRQLTVDDMLQLPFYHPVVEEGLRAAVQRARRALGTRRSTPDLPLCEEAADWALGAG